MSLPEIIPPNNRRQARAGARSLRYYLKLMEDLRRQAELGQRSAADALVSGPAPSASSQSAE